MVRKGEDLFITVPYIDLLNKDKFLDIVINNLPVGFNYLVLIKVRHSYDNYLMAGNQYAFIYHEVNDISLDDFYNSIISRLAGLFEEYDISNDQVMFIQIRFQAIDKKFISDIMVTSDTKLNLEPSVKLKNINYFPLTTDVNIIGNELIPYINKNKVETINITLEDREFNFIDKIKVQNDVLSVLNKEAVIFDKDCKFFLRNSVKPYYILVIKQLKNNQTLKQAYTYDGVLLGSVIDTNISDTNIQREVKNNKLLFQNNILATKEEVLKLKPINATYVLNKKRRNRKSYIENPKIGVIDLETYEVRYNDKTKVYAGGFFTYLSNQVNTYYIDQDTMDSNKVVLDMIFEMLRDKYKGIIFYCHNLGRFDILYILRILLYYNDTPEGQENPFKFGFGLRKNVILQIIIKRKNKNTNKNDTVTIIDSYPILTNSLAKLCSDFNVDTHKDIFPHLFSNENTLFYIGNTPDINYYKHIDLDTYNSMYKKDWSFKEEAIEYLTKDLKSHYEVIRTANHNIFMLFDVDMTSCLTVSKLALTIFLKSHYDQDKAPIPLINNKNIYSDIKLAYYGGITEVYKPTNIDNETLYYYDVNSLYPYVSLNDMPGLDWIKKEHYIDNKQEDLDIENLFGFFYCDVETVDNYLGLLPVRNESGLIFPLGKWSGWYFSEELKFAKKNGYKIKVKKGYSSNRVKNVFKSFVNTLYEIKSNSHNIALAALSKMFLNALTGRFGLNIFNPITKIVNKTTYKQIATTRRIKDQIDITEDKILVSYFPELDPDLCKQFNIDITKASNKYNNPESADKSNFDSISVAISAAITAYGRIHISKIKLGILELGGKIYYSDTDSIVTDLELPKQMVDKKKIGKLKLEHIISKGYFVSNKLYCLITEDKTVLKAKGLDNDCLTVDDYISLWNGNEVVTAIKTESKKNYEEGYVKISSKQIKLDPNSYTKREKLYDDNGIWVDTKPLVLNVTNSSTSSKNDEESDVSFISKKINQKEKHSYESIKFDTDSIDINKTKKDSNININNTENTLVKPMYYCTYESKSMFLCLYVNKPLSLSLYIYEKPRPYYNKKIKNNLLLFLEKIKPFFIIILLLFSAIAYIMVEYENQEIDNQNNIEDINIHNNLEEILPKDLNKNITEKVQDKTNIDVDTTNYEDDTSNFDNINEMLENSRKINNPQPEYTAEERTMLEAQWQNIENRIANGSIEIIQSENNTISSEQINFIKEMISKIDTENTPETPLISPPNTSSTTDSSVFEKLVREIRCGGCVSIYSPTEENFSVNSSPTVENTVRREVGLLGSPIESDSDKPNETENIQTSTALSTEKDNENQDESKAVKPKRKQLIIITKPVPEDGQPLPWPNWTEPSPRPNTDDPEAIKAWKRSTESKRYWVNKFPFLDEHYKQIELASPKTLSETYRLHQNDNSNLTISDCDSNSETESETRSSNLLDNDEPLHLNKLFNEKNLTSKSNNNDDDLFKDSYDIDKLFNRNSENKIKADEINKVINKIDKNEDNYFNNLDQKLKNEIKDKLLQEKDWLENEDN